MNLKSLNDCDCCKYYKITDIDRYVEFNKPLYSIIQKRRTAKLKFISPDNYLKNIAKNFNISIRDNLKYVDFKIVSKYKDDMLSGDKFPLPFYTINNSSQEGRHRVLASKQLKCKFIPVIEFKTEITYEEIIKFVIKFKKYSFEELNKEFKNRGFKGITHLGYKDFNRFIDYNL